MSSARGDALVLLAALIWGVAFYFQKTAMLHIGPLLFVGLRSLVAAVVLTPFALREVPSPTAAPGSVVPIAALGGITFFVAAAVQQYGMITATVINTGFLTALYVVATPFAFWAIKRQRPSASIWACAGIALTGVWTLSGGAPAELSRGDLLVAAAAMIWGLLFVIGAEAGKYARPLTYTCIQFAVVAVVALSLALFFEPIEISAIKNAAESILYVGVLSSAFTFGVMAIALRHIPAPRASIMLSTEVVFSAMAGYALLGERLDATGWLGAGLILSAVVLVRFSNRASESS